MIVAIVQARVGSTRFRGKVLADIAGKSMLERVVDRVQRAHTVEQVVVATTTAEADDAIVELCDRLGIAWFRGSEEDVLDRYYRAALECGATIVVRVTADCPLLDPVVADAVVQRVLDGCDYASNWIRATYPDGLDVEAMTVSALERAWREATSPHEREHVTPFLRFADDVAVGSVEAKGNRRLGHLRWTVDTAEDLDFVRAVYELLPEDSAGHFEEVLSLVEGDPKLMRNSREVIRDEGYYLSLTERPIETARPRRLDRSLALKHRAEELIPSCTQTFSKGPTQFVQGVAPVFLERAAGSHVWDVDGNEYVDYVMALGAIILGHCYPRVNDAVADQLTRGTAFSLPHPLEVELAELLVELIPCAEMARYGKNGSDATSAAVRAARAHTGRDVVVCCGYHGWQDWFIGTTTRRAGVPDSVAELTKTFRYNDPESLEHVLAEHRGRVALVILEPFGVVEPEAGFLERVQQLTRDAGALLAFDEVVTGGRFAVAGGQELFGVVPDLACFGKAIGNGFPIAAVVGRRDVMRVFDEIFFSVTFGGDAASLAASIATLHELVERDVIPRLWEQGRKLQDGYNTLAAHFGLADRTECIGFPPRTVLTFRDGDGQESPILKSLFQQEVIKRGILSGGYHNLSFSHTNADVEQTLRAYRDALELMAQAVASGDPSALLEGPPVQAVFRSF